MNFNKLTSNFYFRAAVLLSVVKFAFDNPLLLAGLVVMSGAIVYMDSTDVDELKNIKSSISNLDLSQLKSLIKSTKREVAEVEEVITEPVAEKPTVEKEFKTVSKSKGFGKI